MRRRYYWLGIWLTISATFFLQWFRSLIMADQVLPWGNFLLIQSDSGSVFLRTYPGGFGFLETVVGQENEDGTRPARPIFEGQITAWNDWWFGISWLIPAFACAAIGGWPFAKKLARSKSKKPIEQSIL